MRAIVAVCTAIVLLSCGAEAQPWDVYKSVPDVDVKDWNLATSCSTQQPLVWDGVDDIWASANWNGGQWPFTGAHTYVDGGAVTVAADFGPALSLTIGQTALANVIVNPGVTLDVATNVTVGTQGTLNVNGTLGAVDVSCGGLLSGDGTIDANVQLTGTVAPGNSPGILTINAPGGGFQFLPGSTYDCQIGQWDSPGGLPPVPPLPIPPMDPTINDRIHASAGGISLDGELKLTAVSKLHWTVLHPDPPHPQVQWYGDQIRIIASTVSGQAVSGTFATLPDPQPVSWDTILTGTPEWHQGHIGRGVFLTRQNDGGPNDAPGVSYSTNATKLHLFQACDGDTNGDRTLNGRDIQNIQSYGLYRVRADPGPGYVWPPDWPQGDVTGDGIVDSLDIGSILATGLWPTNGYAAVDPGDPSDEVVDLLLYPEDYQGTDFPPAQAGTLIISTGQTPINGYVIRSPAGIFSGEPAANLGWFAEHTDTQIGGNMGFVLNGEHSLGKVLGPEWSIVAEGEPGDPFEDLTFIYTIEGMPGTFVGNLIVVPEPSTAAMLLATAALALLWPALRRRCRPSRCVIY